MVGTLETSSKNIGSPPPARCPVQAENMDIPKQQLDKLNGEIDAVSLKIDEKETKWENAASDDKKADYKDSIKVLNEALKGLRSDRSLLLAAPPCAPPGSCCLVVSLLLCCVCPSVRGRTCVL